MGNSMGYVCMSSFLTPVFYLMMHLGVVVAVGYSNSATVMCGIARNNIEYVCIRLKLPYGSEESVCWHALSWVPAEQWGFALTTW